MSVTLTLVPLAVAVGLSLTAGSVALLNQRNNDVEIENLQLETAFTDATLLQKTLSEHGLNVEVLGENEMIVRSESGELRYYRSSVGEAFSLGLRNICNMQELLDSVDELENEYGRNVQSFTYNKVMTSLIEHGMSVDTEEIMEDDSIVLTLNV